MTTVKEKTTGVFAAQLHRAAAQRGKLDAVYRALSDHWTAILQRMWPVWTLIGPDLADPGHIEVHSRTVYLDSDALLGEREQIAHGRLDARRVLATFGVAIHEVLHAKHTKRWAVEYDLELADSEDPDERQLAADRRLLEEPRMEASGVREFPDATRRGRFVRAALGAAVLDVMIPVFAAQVITAAATGAPVTRDMCGRAMSYLQARTHYGILEPTALDGLNDVWEQCLGAATIKALDDLFARVIWIADGDTDAMDRAAREYRALIGPPDPPPSSSSQDGEGNQGDGGEGSCGTGSPGAGEEANASAQSLADALEDAITAGREAQLEQYDHDISLKDTVAEASRHPASASTGKGAGTGMPAGRMPDRGVDRPPHPDERRMAQRYAHRLRQAQKLGTRRIDKRTPGGRFNPRAYTRGRAQSQRGLPVTSHPWQATRVVRAPIEEPHVALIIDTSGSMAGHEYALGPIAWVLQTGLGLVGGRMAISLFGNAAALLCDGAKTMSRVPGIRTGGGTAFAGDAVEIASAPLDMTNPRRPRFLYCISDGGWADTRAGVQKIRELSEHGVPTIHIAIGAEPLSVEAERVVVITDPAQAMDVIAADTVQALRAGNRGR